MLILGIETSCDETSAAIVENGKKIISSFTHSQIKEHSKYFGVVPEIASRMHLEMILICIDSALKDAGLKLTQIDAIAVTNRPGLIGSLLIGVSAAKSISFAYDKPLIPVDHIHAHLYAPNLEMDVSYPNIGLVVSGGHTLLTINDSPVQYELIGTTIDDAIGEAYDKIAKHFSLEYPGGPIIDKLAQKGNPFSYNFPLIMLKKRDKYNFSFSGLKTAIINFRNNFKNQNFDDSLENILASFQRVAIEVLYKKTIKLCQEKKINKVILTGGVACNSYLRKIFNEDKNLICYIPSPKLCTDNAAIVAGVSYHIEERADLTLDVSSRILPSNLKGKNRKYLQ